MHYFLVYACLYTPCTTAYSRDNVADVFSGVYPGAQNPIEKIETGGEEVAVAQRSLRLRDRHHALCLTATHRDGVEQVHFP